MKFILRYLPKNLSNKDKKIQAKELIKSKKFYKKNKYYTRKNISSFHSKESKHIKNAKKLYNITNLVINNKLAKLTGCTKKALKKIINKGEGAYYSSGSRPNQTPHSWGIARLASAITAGKASNIDYKILENGCKKTSKALILARNARRKFGFNFGTKKVPKIKI